MLTPCFCLVNDSKPEDYVTVHNEEVKVGLSTTLIQHILSTSNVTFELLLDTNNLD